MQRQQRQDIGRPASNLMVEVPRSPAISPGHWGFVLKMRFPIQAGGFVWKCLPLLECCNSTFFGMLQPQQTLSSPARARWLTGLLLFTLSYRWPRSTSVLARIDIFAHRPGADQRGQRGGDISEHGIASSQEQWHPAHSCFPSPCSFFFLSDKTISLI